MQISNPLADYLRALRLSARPTEELREELRRLDLDTSSQLPFLLVATAPTAEARHVAWRALVEKDFKAAISCLRFVVADDESFEARPAHERSTTFLSDILDGIDGAIEPHFPHLADDLHAVIAGGPAQRLAIEGEIASDYVHYALFDAEEEKGRIRVGSHEKRPRMYGHALRQVGFGPEAGRVFGVRLVRDALQELIEHRSFRGGLTWMQELTIGRLRHLQRVYDVPIDWPVDLIAARDLLRPSMGAWVSAAGLLSGQSFSITELIEDLGHLIDSGMTHLELWWEDLPHLDLRTADGRARFARTLDEYYRRRQRAYADVVAHNMPNVAPLLRTLRMMPLRFEIEVELHNRPGYDAITLHHRRWPVRYSDEAGADVGFPENLSDMNSNESWDAYVRRTDELLERFGRSFPERQILGGGTQIPDFEGHATSAEERPDETAVVRGAMRWMTDDIKNLFRELPEFTFT